MSPEGSRILFQQQNKDDERKDASIVWPFPSRLSKISSEEVANALWLSQLTGDRFGGDRYRYRHRGSKRSQRKGYERKGENDEVSELGFQQNGELENGSGHVQEGATPTHARDDECTREYTRVGMAM